MKYLIVGGCGFIGVNLVRRCLREANAQVTVVDSLDPRLAATKDHLPTGETNLEFVHGDMRDEALMRQLLPACDVVIHCAGQTSHILSMQNPLLDVEHNCAATIALLESVRKYNPDVRVVFVSSSTIAGRSSKTVDEQQTAWPLDIYSANKLVAEHYFRIYANSFDLSTIVLRFANIYGPYGKPRPEFGFINYFIDRALHDQEITVYGTGQQRRNVMYVGDATEIMLQAPNYAALHGKVWIASGDEHLSILEIAETIVRVFGRGSVRQIEWPDERRRIEIGDANITSQRLRQETDWSPQTDFVAGLEQTLRETELADTTRPEDLSG